MFPQKGPVHWTATTSKLHQGQISVFLCKTHSESGPEETLEGTRVNQQSWIEGDGSTPRASLSPPSPGETLARSTGAFPQLPSASPSSSPPEWQIAFTPADISCLPKTYDERMYPVWPVINAERINNIDA